MSRTAVRGCPGREYISLLSNISKNTLQTSILFRTTSNPMANQNRLVALIDGDTRLRRRRRERGERTRIASRGTIGCITTGSRKLNSQTWICCQLSSSTLGFDHSTCSEFNLIIVARMNKQETAAHTHTHTYTYKYRRLQDCRDKLQAKHGKGSVLTLSTR